MYQFPYSTIFEDSRAPLPSRSRLISNAIELFEASGRSSLQAFERLQLLSDSRRLWLLIAGNLARAGNEPSRTQQAGFLAAVHGVLQEIERRRFKTSTGSLARPETRQELLS